MAVLVLKQWSSDSRGRSSLQYRQVRSKRKRQFAVVRIARRGSVLPPKQPKHESRAKLCYVRQAGSGVYLEIGE